MHADDLGCDRQKHPGVAFCGGSRTREGAECEGDAHQVGPTVQQQSAGKLLQSGAAAARCACRQTDAVLAGKSAHPTILSVRLQHCLCYHWQRFCCPRRRHPDCIAGGNSFCLLWRQSWLQQLLVSLTLRGMPVTTHSTNDFSLAVFLLMSTR
jgi:hypothetical protein